MYIIVASYCALVSVLIHLCVSATESYVVHVEIWDVHVIWHDVYVHSTHIETHMHTQNIELQVQLDNLKKELGEKDQLLMQAK